MCIPDNKPISTTAYFINNTLHYINSAKNNMTNTHSRPAPMEIEEPVLCYDKLILKLEEIDTATKHIEIVCYIAYDHEESEYYVCGKRGLAMAEDFKFYCKKKSHIISFLKYVIGDTTATPPSSKINHILYNYKNLDLDGEEEHVKEFIDYHVLKEQEDRNCELAGYDGEQFSERWLSPLLKMLKNLRY